MRIKVAVLNPIAGVGGAEISCLELVRRLTPNYEFHIMVPAEGEFARSARTAGAEVHLLEWPAALMGAGEIGKRVNLTRMLAPVAALPQFGRRISELVRRMGAEVLITNGVKCHVAGAVAPRSAPVVWYFRNGWEDRRLSRRMLSLLAPRCDAGVCISHYVETQVREHISRTMPLRMVYNMVDFETFHLEVAPAGDLAKANGEFWFGIVGPITPIKGHWLFLKAAATVAERMPAARFVIAGGNFYATERESDYEASLRQIAQQPLLAGKVLFVGFRNDVPSVLRALDCLVQPNIGPEGLGRSVLEAMACAVPVIAVDRWGPAELVQHRQTGLLFPCGDASVLADRMLCLASNAHLAAQLGQNGRAWIRAHVQPDRIAAEFSEFLDQVVSKRNPYVAGVSV